MGKTGRPWWAGKRWCSVRSPYKGMDRCHRERYHLGEHVGSGTLGFMAWPNHGEDMRPITRVDLELALARLKRQQQQAGQAGRSE